MQNTDRQACVLSTITPDTCLSGAEALELVQKNNSDVVVLDIEMPGMDGMEVWQAIRA